jgi:leucyl aminopeptidase (aminopeptidase T)
MVGVGKDLFLKAMRANQKQIKKLGQELANKMKNSKKMHITSPSGTDLVVNVVKNSIDLDDGDSTRKGALNNVPFGEVAMAPVNIAEGCLAVDYSRLNIWPKDKVKLVLRRGKIVDANNAKAKKLVRYFLDIDGEKAIRIVEASIGINPEHKELIGNIIHDEKILGSAHVAFGGFGDVRPCKIHEDVIILKPTIRLDDEVVVKDGNILLDQ